MTKILTKTGIQKFLTAIIIVFSLFAILPISTAVAEEEPAAQNQENNQEQAQAGNEEGAEVQRRLIAQEDGENAEGEGEENDDNGDNDGDVAENEDEEDAPPAADADTHDLMNIGSIIGDDTLEAVRGQMNILLFIQGALNHLLWPVLVLIGGLLDNSLLFGIGMEETLRSIWIPIRNLTNILFILILVGIALYNVLGLGDENNEYAIKTILPKIIIGIIAVNFSFFGMKVVLDGVNMLTVSIFSLPNQVSEGMSEVVGKGDTATIQAICARELMWSTEQYREADEEGIKKRQTNMSKDYGSGAIGGIILGDTDTPDTDEDEEKINFLCNERGELTTHGQRFLSSWDYNNAALAMALNMGEIQFFEIPTADSIENIKNLMINTLLSMVFYFVYAVSFIALFVVLLVRIVALWLFVAMSPILILVMSTGIKEKLGSGISQMVDSIAKYILAPVMVAIPMTIGWIMLNAVKASTSFMLNEAGGEAGGFIAGIPVTGMNDLQQFMVGIGTIAVVWVGVFAAADGTVAKAATDKIQGWARMAGTYIGATPFRHLPIVPIKGERASLSAIKRGLEDRMAGGGMLPDKQEAIRRNISGRGQRMSPRDLQMNVKRGDDFMKWMSDNQNMSSKDIAEAVKQFKDKRSDQYETVRKNLRGIDPALEAKLDRMARGENSAVDDFRRNQKFVEFYRKQQTQSQAGTTRMDSRNIGSRARPLTSLQIETLDTKINAVTSATAANIAEKVKELVQLDITDIKELKHFKDVLGEAKYNELIGKDGIDESTIRTAINEAQPTSTTTTDTEGSGGATT